MRKFIFLFAVLFSACHVDDNFYENDSLVIVEIAKPFYSNLDEDDRTKYIYKCENINRSYKHMSDVFVYVKSNNEYRMGDTITIEKKSAK